MVQLEEEKEEQIQALRMQLYENLNLALCQKEMEALRLNLERLREEKLELQAEQKATELQDLKIQLQALLDEKKRMEREEKTKKAKPIEEGSNLVGGPKRRLRQGVPLFKTNGASTQAKNGAVEQEKKATLSRVKKEPQKKDKVQKKGTIKLGPFTRND